ncbi:hypothetical protein BS50DRAFT_576894 [Corynespora cassiicola Philippines]|uniref:CoA-dependent acyltransferase n=1 Tax=Corynespora cassiicola Philippines TaxID=1448308 RepID=A0A2T2NCC1_CORCC|nr:hypothetical protein BS50DRAFT_576894 [Corynespora cassiicola Philippines]
MPDTQQPHWLSRYASNAHAWNLFTLSGGKQGYTRPLGLVETSFDIDGSEYGGRADMNALMRMEIRHSLATKADFRRRIALAWTYLRLQHVLLMGRVVEDSETGRRGFVVELERSREEAVKNAEKNIVWVEDLYDEVDAEDIYRHCLNVARIIKPGVCLSRMHVLPLVPLPNGNFELRLIIIMAHETSDGLAAYNWFSHFMKILNTPLSTLEKDIDTFRSSQHIKARLPPAQEDLYPPISGSKARERWFWAIMRVLRHVRKPLPQTFSNPLHRAESLQEAASYPPKYSAVFDYSPSNKPPLNSGYYSTNLSKSASARLISLCRGNKISVGAGCFALAAISMMEIYESSNLSEPSRNHPAFAASFPLNPRPFFNYNGPPESCMLAFNDGIIMPFLHSSLPIEDRFKLVARTANRELRAYQKRLDKTQGSSMFDPTYPGRVLAHGYLLQLERIELRQPPHRKTGIAPQGAYPAKTHSSGATCGVSSLGSIAHFFKPGMYDFSAVDTGERDFVADYRDMRIGVRARDDEFLIVTSTDFEGLVGFGVSYDGCAIDEAAAEMWGEKIRGLLEVDGEARL